MSRVAGEAGGGRCHVISGVRLRKWVYTECEVVGSWNVDWGSGEWGMGGFGLGGVLWRRVRVGAGVFKGGLL